MTTDKQREALENAWDAWSSNPFDRGDTADIVTDLLAAAIHLTNNSPNGAIPLVQIALNKLTEVETHTYHVDIEVLEKWLKWDTWYRLTKKSAEERLRILRKDFPASSFRLVEGL